MTGMNNKEHSCDCDSCESENNSEECDGDCDCEEPCEDCKHKK